MAKTKLASRAAAWLRDGRILVIPEIIITDQASPPSLGRRAEWISRCGAAARAHFHHIRAGRRARNSRRGSPAGLLCPWETPKTRLRSPCENLAQLAKQPIDGVLALRAAQRRRLCPPRYLLSSEADLWSCRTSYSLVLLGVVHLLEPRRRHGDSSGQSRAGRDHNLQMRQARDVRSRALRLPARV